MGVTAIQATSQCTFWML